MSLQYVIDGYNITKHPLFTKLFPKKTNHLKDDTLALLEFIRQNRACGSPKNKITVVFDGYGEASATYQNDAGIKVIFSRNISADERIIKMIENNPESKNTVVVSDDKEIKLLARAYGVRIVGVQDFIGRKEKFRRKNEEAQNLELSYSQMHKINEELKKIWLK